MGRGGGRVGSAVRNGAGAGPQWARPGAPEGVVPRQETLSAVSSITKLVCSEASSVPVNFRVTLWPA
ncbi:hypothetical protein GCM10010195_45310 [Kitasatospora griseola]|nr:hypothetical protein GCM10010195_45310 [Kitasatospora griseola]